MVYRILDENGNKIGVPIKASSLSSKPTLNTVEKKFTANEMMREVLKRQTKDIVEAVLKGNPQHFKDFMDELQKKQVYTVLRQNKEGLIYGITFVDNRSRCVFNGSDLGKTYSAASLQSRMANNGGGSNKNIAGQKLSDSMNFNSSSRNSLNVVQNEQKSKEKDLHNETLLEKLITPKEDKMFVPFQLLQKKRHKKNRNLRL
ncbi:hypothetical protein [Segetibacter koreensis]|uniref:hypothetical protein n=1 Tax=Segetibacter koreensis TaxID=398037 RepID=UPI0003A17FC5|nr:hypothetical protein [Segetibacter koreensis]